METGGTLRGSRREMTKEDFEELVSVHSRMEEILGYVGATERKLAAWIRRTYHMAPEQAMRMIAMDGNIRLRKLLFDLSEKNAALVLKVADRELAEPAGDDRKLRDILQTVLGGAEGEEQTE